MTEDILEDAYSQYMHRQDLGKAHSLQPYILLFSAGGILQ